MNMIHRVSSKPKQQRNLRIKGTYNFRDMGGYPTKDGRYTRWRVLYRSDHLHHLSPKSKRVVSNLQIDTLIDFRTLAEQDRHPDRLPTDHGIKLVSLPLTNPANPDANIELEDQLRSGSLPSIDAHTYLTNEYVRFASHHMDEFHQYFKALRSAQGKPTLIHCTAGKDRTGFAGAITLRLLGVPDDIIIQDYLLTNQYYRRTLRYLLPFIQITRGKAIANYIRSLTEAKPEYLMAALRTIDEAFHSFEDYLIDGLGLSSSAISQLKNNLLA